MIFTERELKFIKWYDYLWLLIPIAGIAAMAIVVTGRERASRGE